MPTTHKPQETHTRLAPRLLMGALIGAGVALAAGSLGRSFVESSAWLLGVDMMIGAVAGLIVALVSRS